MEPHPVLVMPLSVEDARQRNLCRLCGESASVPITLDYGKEFAHTSCVSKLYANNADPETVDHPDHYGGKDNPYEVIKVLEAWRLEEDALLWNMGKYLGRWDAKGETREQVGKAIWYGLRRLAVLDGLDPDTYNDAIKAARKVPA